jgi:phosphatidylserine decarboxylase
MKIPIAREGRPLIAAGLALTALAFVFGFRSAGVLFGLASLALAGFFRDPERTPPPGDGLIVAPADGRVVAVERKAGAEPMSEGETKISIFMSPLDVHVNRSPVSGQVAARAYSPGKFIAAYKETASAANEQNALTVRDREGRMLRLVQIAGVLARRIVCHVNEGDSVALGQRIGIIMFGSRVDVFLPPSARAEVVKGARVTGGRTIIGRFA